MTEHVTSASENQVPKVDKFLSEPGTYGQAENGAWDRTTDYGKVTHHFADSPLNLPAKDAVYDRLVHGLPEKTEPEVATDKVLTDAGNQTGWQSAGTAEVYGKNRTLFENVTPDGRFSVSMTDAQREKIGEINPNSPFAHVGQKATEGALGAIPAVEAPTPPQLQGPSGPVNPV